MATLPAAGRPSHKSFIAPADNVLDNYMFGFDAAGVNITFTIVPWDETSGPTGGPLYTDNFVSVAGDNFVSVIGLALTPGNMYAAIVDMNGYTGTSVHFMLNVTGNPTGDASWFNGTWQFLNSGWSTKFRAEFIVPAPGVLALLGLAGAATPRRRRR